MLNLLGLGRRWDGDIEEESRVKFALVRRAWKKEVGRGVEVGVEVL